MGYITNFTLTVRDPTGELIEETESATRCFQYGCWTEHFQYLDDYIDHLEGGVEAKWYNFNEDMTALSERHPTLTFMLDGQGEDQGDVWRVFYRDGERRFWKAPRPVPPKTWEECI